MVGVYCSQCSTGWERNSARGMPSPPTRSDRVGWKAGSKAASPGSDSGDRLLFTSMATSFRPDATTKSTSRLRSRQ